MSTPTQDLTAAGVSIWLDDLSRRRISTGNLQELIDTRDVTGVTTNPTIFQAAIGNPDDDSYASALATLGAGGADPDAAIFALTTEDVQAACDIFRPVFSNTGGVDGRVSIEVSPDLAHDTEATIAEAKRLWTKVGRSNALIKIPATKAGIPAITEVIGTGISVNVTLIFSLERYAEVIDAYLVGVRLARARRIDLTTIHSVASFFVSRVDTEIDKRLTAIGTDAALALRGQAGIANARLAYELFAQRFGDPDVRRLVAAGANVQRPLWASTGVKDPALPDTLYVTELVARWTVNTMPENTLEATFDHARVSGDSITAGYAAAHAVFERLASVGVDFADATHTLEDEGVAKFIDSWQDLRRTVATALEGAQA